MAGDLEGGGTGSDEVHGALRELLGVGRRSIAAYREAEAAAPDHRIHAAIRCLRRDHERHMEELAAVLGESLRPLSLADGAAESDPVAGVIRAGDATGEALLEAVRRAEADLHACYLGQLAESCEEPVRTMLKRHRREEQAHVEWLRESRWWSGGRPEPGSAPGASGADAAPRAPEHPDR